MANGDMLRSQRPTIFITHSNVDGYHIALLADEFRKAQIEALAINADNDVPPGRLLKDSIIGHSSASKVLLIALSPNALTSEWFQHTLQDEVLPELKGHLDRIIVLDLIPRTRRTKLPRYLKSYGRFNLGNYEKGVEELLQEVGSASQTLLSQPSLGKRRDSEYYTVSGAFEVGRPSSIMFSELKRQLYETPYKIDLKYLYWDVRAASRWQEITQMSRYLTTQTAINVLTRHADELADQVFVDGAGSELTFINFGVGTGQKDFLILKALLGEPGAADAPKVAYFPVDESLPMIQITIAALEDLMASYHDNLAIRFVLDDFQFAQRFQRYVTKEEEVIFGHGHRPPRLLAFMDTLGNFDEKKILRLLWDFMSEEDILLLGVELIGNRDDDALIANYSDGYMKAFLAGPIIDVFGRTEPDPPDFAYEVVENKAQYSRVPRAATVVGRVTHRSQPIEMFHSTKYDGEALEAFLVEAGFSISDRVFSENDPPRYANYILRKVGTG